MSMVFDSFLGMIFSPLLGLPPLVAIGSISFLLSLFITLVYRLTTDQTVMKALKEEMKHLQQEMKQLSKDPEKMLKVQKKALEKQMKYMTSSFKPMLITMLPLLIIFPWLGAHMAYYPLVQDVPFTVDVQFAPGAKDSATLEVSEGLALVSDASQAIVDGKARWTVKGHANAVPYAVTVVYGGDRFDKTLLITSSKDDRQYLRPVEAFKDKAVESITLGNEKIVGLNLFGWKLGWLGTYIIFSIVFSITLRKLLNVH